MAPEILDEPKADRHEGRSLSRSLFQGTSSIGAAVSIERGLGFVAHLLAARIGGTHVFGTYSLALTTANSVAAYAGAGIGTTANRFSGVYAFGSPQYSQLQRTLALVSGQSALIAAVLLWIAAGPIAARMIGNPSLTPLLHLAALSSAAIILLECMRGFLIGQRRYTALLTLSLAAGGGMLLVIPPATLAGPAAMITGQALVAIFAVSICLLFARSLKVRVYQTASVAGHSLAGNSAAGNGVRASAIWLFGLGQLLGVVGLNAAGWWTASLVSRSDQSMVQMSFYIAATQIRNVIAMAPGLVQQSCYALLTNEAGDGYGGPNRVLLASTLLASVLGLVLTGLAVAVLPWAMGMLYGNAFRGAEPAAAVAISTGLVHMAGAPAASRLTIVSLKLIGTINGLWAVAVIALGPVFIPRGGAVPATAIMLGMHVVNAVLVLGCLRKKRTLPAGLTAMSMPMVAGSVLFALLGWIRFGQPAMRVELSVASVLLALVLVAMVLRIGYTAGCVPPPARWRGLAEDVLKSGKARSAAC